MWSGWQVGAWGGPARGAGVVRLELRAAAGRLMTHACRAACDARRGLGPGRRRMRRRPPVGP
eukprot:7047566-Prymnesium_polylepis.1